MTVRLIGVEIEGAFNRGWDIKDTYFHSDSSVEIDGVNGGEDYQCSCCAGECEHDSNDSCSCYCEDGSSGQFDKIGELISIPLPFDKIHEWVNRNYPLDFNHSCGMHVHFSFKNDYEYSQFCSKKFYTYFLAEITAWAVKNKVKPKSRFFNRLNGKNTFCYNNYSYDNNKKQLRSHGERYNILNYCYDKHRTIEIRLSHVWQNKNYAFMYIECCYDIFNTWLLLQKRSIRHSLKVEVLN